MSATTERKTSVTQYPEHDKLHQVSAMSQACFDFIEWLVSEKKIRLCSFVEGREGDEWLKEWLPVSNDMNGLLSEFYDIDLNALEQEKRAMLKDLQAMNEKNRKNEDIG